MKAIVIDDNAKTLDIVSEILAQYDFKVTTCNEGQSAFDLIKKEMPSLVLLSACISGINGHSVLLKILNDEKTKDIPVIMLISSGQEKNIFGNLPSTVFLSKPFKSETLITTIKEVLG
ncbi:MAG TPA: response regulator [Elusimicrobiales bacterium]|nr:response regulator [Elusimicrobiales bacterium]